MLSIITDCLTISCLLLLLVILVEIFLHEPELGQALHARSLEEQLHHFDMKAKMAAPALMTLTAAYLQARTELLNECGKDNPHSVPPEARHD